MQEEWREIKGWHGKYLISTLGHLKSMRGKHKVCMPEGYVTKGCIDSVGYRCVTLRRPGVKFRTRIHVLMGEAFLTVPTDKKVCCINHIDGNKLNNTIENLEWITRGDNIRHAVRIGIFNIKGENHPHAKLTNEKVIEMRRLRREENITYSELGKRFGVERRQASDAVRGVNWGWLQP